MNNLINLQEKRDQIDAKNKRISEIIDNIVNLAIGIYNNMANANPHLNIGGIDSETPIPVLSDGLFNLSIAIVIDCARKGAIDFYAEAIELLGHEQSLLAACCVVAKDGLHTAFDEIKALK